MKCLNDGALQAHLDGELSPPEMSRADRHLSSCARCAARYAHVQSIQTCVNTCLAALEPADLAGLPIAVPYIAAPAPSWRWRWAVVMFAGTLAALALFLVNARPRSAPVRAVRHPAEPPPVQTAVVQPPRPRPVSAPSRPRRSRPKPVVDEFVPLDDADPIQIGMVVRIMLPVSDAPANAAQTIAADVMIGEDGRPRAIRFVE